MCRNFKEKGGRSGLDLLEKNTWILLLDSVGEEIYRPLWAMFKTVLYATQPAVSPAHSILKYGPAEKVMESGQRGYREGGVLSGQGAGVLG